MRSVFINAMSAVSSRGAGTLTFTFTKSNVPSPVSFDISVDVVNSDPALVIADKIWNALNTGLSNNNALYNGTPAFLTDIYTPFTFQVVRTEHIISVWSEASFTLYLNNTSDAFVELSSAPIYGTLKDIKSFAPISGVKLTDMNNRQLSDEEIIIAARAASSTIVSMFNGFNIIPSSYLQVESGEWMRGVCCRYAPVIWRSPVQAQGPYTANY